MINSNELLTEVMGRFDRLSQAEKTQLLEKYGFVYEKSNGKATSGVKFILGKKQKTALGPKSSISIKAANGANVRFCATKNRKIIYARGRIPVVKTAQAKITHNED